MYRAASAGLLGLGGKGASAATPEPGGGLSWPKEMDLAMLRKYRTAKASSDDRTGGQPGCPSTPTG